MQNDAMLFEGFRLHRARRLLLRDNAPVRLGGRALDILLLLANAQGEVLSNRDILAAAWPDLHVDEGVLRVHVSNLRRALGVNRNGDPLIQNVVGRGYRLNAEVVREATATPSQDGRAAPAPPPRRLGRLIGRESLVTSLCEDLQRRQVLTLVGPGGAGKTAVALEVAARLAEIYDQVAFVDLAAITAPELVGHSLAMAFGLTMEDPTPALETLLRGRRSLVVLDNCEHVIEAAALLVDRLCSTVPGVDLLATSREPLRIDAEWVHRLPPLEVPPPSSETTAEVLEFTAAELFVERACARNQAFRLNDRAARLVGDICRRLEGSPLAIELTASWCDTFPLETLVDRLDGHLILRAPGRRNAPARHRTLRATIDWSHDLLGPSEQRLFRRLAAFAGEFSLDAAVAVASDRQLSADEVIETLAQLCAKSLLAITTREGGLAYRLLMPLRAYAAEKLEAADELDVIHRRHLLWTLSELRQAEDRWWTTTRAEWLRQHVGLVDEVRAAGRWATERPDALDLASNLASESAPLWFRFSLTPEGRVLAETVLAAAGQGKLDEAAELGLRTALGVGLMYSRAPNEEVVGNWERVLRLAQARRDLERQMLGHWGLWLMAAFRGDTRAKLAHAEAFAQLADKRGVPEDMATAHRLLASTVFAVGRLDEARHGIEQMVTLLARLDRQPCVMRFQFEQAASGHSLLSRIHWLQGRPRDAVEAAHNAVRSAEEAGHGLSLAYALLDAMAHTAILVGDAATTHEVLDRLAAMPESQGLQASEAVDAMRAMALFEEGRTTNAMALLVKTYNAPGTSRLAGRFPSLIGRVADILTCGGRPDLGLTLIDDAAERFVRDPEDVMLPDIWRARALALASIGQRAQAETLLRAALARAAAQGTAGWQLRIAIDLAELTGLACDHAVLKQSLARNVGGTGDHRRGLTIVRRRPLPATAH